ncbi:MAG: UDP-N-acetylmuramate--L-alanine ligase [Deltaproteobacteria bacterium]|nr:UDP-N-acetylmuramate--L-alanine ligase [Deltaproteobacteria bacterium]
MHIHLIAICGTAMGTLAGMLKAKGFQVSGSDDNVYPPMSTQLEKWGIAIQKGFSAKNLQPQPDLVIVGNAVSKTNPEVEALLQSDIRYLSLPQALGEFFLADKKSLIAAGTHGKSTTTSLLAWMLYDLGFDPSLLVGAIPKNFDSSFRLGQGPYFVIEGDEYDTAFFDKGPKFWHYRPYQVILTGIEFDHADIYKDLEHVMKSFEGLVDRIPPEGCLYVCGDNENNLKLLSRAKCKVVTYGLGDKNQIRATKVRLSPRGASFTLVENGVELGVLESPMAGNHNLQNLLGVLALLRRLPPPSPLLIQEGELQSSPLFTKNLKIDALPLLNNKEGVGGWSIQSSLSLFQGVKRRQEIRGVVNHITVIDDFAHHPTAIAETLDAIRSKYPHQKVWAIFEPRSNTSKRAIFQQDFPKALSHAQEVLLAKVFMPEKVKDSAVLDVEQVAEDIRKAKVPARSGLEVDEIVNIVSKEAKPGDVLLVMSNGGFGGIHQKLLESL